MEPILRPQGLPGMESECVACCVSCPALNNEGNGPRYSGFHTAECDARYEPALPAQAAGSAQPPASALAKASAAVERTLAARDQEAKQARISEPQFSSLASSNGSCNCACLRPAHWTVTYPGDPEAPGPFYVCCQACVRKEGKVLTKTGQHTTECDERLQAQHRTAWVAKQVDLGDGRKLREARQASAPASRAVASTDPAPPPASSASSAYRSGSARNRTPQRAPGEPPRTHKVQFRRAPENLEEQARWQAFFPAGVTIGSMAPQEVPAQLQYEDQLPPDECHPQLRTLWVAQLHHESSYQQVAQLITRVAKDVQAQVIAISGNPHDKNNMLPGWYLHAIFTRADAAERVLHQLRQPFYNRYATAAAGQLGTQASREVLYASPSSNSPM